MNRLESIVNDKLLSILSPSISDIDPWTLADVFGVRIVTAPTKSFLAGDESRPFVIIDDRQPFDEQRVDLAHELCHYISHTGNQLFLPEELSILQENQSRRMTQYFLCPTSMMQAALDGRVFGSPNEVAPFVGAEFGVPLWFAKKRMQLFFNDIQIDHSPQFGRDYDTVWEHPMNGRRIYFKNGNLVRTLERSR